MATPISPGSWDLGPARPGVRFGVSVAMGVYDHLYAEWKRMGQAE